jgi:hypothetical protein
MIKNGFFLFVVYLIMLSVCQTTVLSGSNDKVKLSQRLTNQALRHEGVRRSGCKDPRILDLGTSSR